MSLVPIVPSRKNRVLKVKPHDINLDEITLSRYTRSMICQLRSGWFRMLRSYLARNFFGKLIYSPIISQEVIDLPRAPRRRLADLRCTDARTFL